MNTCNFAEIENFHLEENFTTPNKKKNDRSIAIKINSSFSTTGVSFPKQKTSMNHIPKTEYAPYIHPAMVVFPLWA